MAAKKKEQNKNGKEQKDQRNSELEPNLWPGSDNRIDDSICRPHDPLGTDRKKKENGSIFQNENEQQKKLRKKNNGRHFFFLWKGLTKIIYKIIEHVPSVPQICLETGETEGGWDLPYLGLGAYEFIIEWQTSWQLSEYTLADPKAISL